MVKFGWAIASIGAIGLCSSMAFEFMIGEPFLLLVAKACLGIMAIGGTILGVSALKRK